MVSGLRLWWVSIHYIHGLFRLVLLISEMFTRILTHPLPRPRIIHSRPCCQRHMSPPLEVPEPSHAASRLIPCRAVVFGIHFLRQIPLQFNGEWKHRKNLGNLYKKATTTQPNSTWSLSVCGRASVTPWNSRAEERKAATSCEQKMGAAKNWRALMVDGVGRRPGQPH